MSFVLTQRRFTELKSALAILLLGAALRAVALPTPGSGDVDNFKTWTYAVATAGVTRVYGVGPEHPTFTLIPGLELDIEYPPVSLYELAIVGRIHQAAHRGQFPDTPLLTLLVKRLPVVFEIGLIAVMFAGLRRACGRSAARWAVAAYWVNPAAVIDVSLGGYLDALMVLPAVASLVAAVAGLPLLAGGLITAAILTKLQGVFVAPAVIVAVWHAGPP